MIPAGTKVYFAKNPVDLRRLFDGLAATAASALAKDPAQGGMFVFVNRRGNQVRVLFRDPLGWCILAKRLVRGRFKRVRVSDDEVCWEAEPRALIQFLDDIDIPSRQGRSRRPRPASHLELVQS